MTDAELAGLIERFYARVRADERLGPLFNRAVEDWPEHLTTLQAFWSSVMQTSGRYKGNPLAVHLRHRGAIEPAMFERWLELWRQTAREELAPAEAEAIIGKAERIAESLKLALFFRTAPDRGRATA